MQAITDRSRIKKTDPGHPEQCEVVCPYYDAFADKETAEEVKNKCRNAEWGCAECKRNLAGIINEKFRPIREKREELAKDPETIHKIIRAGSEKAREKAVGVIKEVRSVMMMY